MSSRLKVWHPAVFILCHLFAALLFGSWLYEPTRAYWDVLDNWVFFSLNGSLQWGETWQLIWAWGNNRATDIVVGVLMILLFIHFIFSGGRRLILERMVIFGLMCVIIVISAEGLLDLFQDALGFKRESPSRVLEPVYRLSELVPHIKAKDASGNSFPGDHGTVTFIWLTFVWLYAGWSHRLTALIMAVLILLPRMVGGAHWLTDNLVGSGTLVLLYMAWFLCTPFGFLVRTTGEKVLGFILPRSWQRVPEF